MAAARGALTVSPPGPRVHPAPSSNKGKGGTAVHDDIDGGVATATRAPQPGSPTAVLPTSARRGMTTTEAKIGAAGGIAYGVISLVAWQLWACPSFPHIPEFPRLSASAATWAHWYVQH